MILGISSFAYGWSIGIQGNMPLQPFNEVDLVNKAISAGLHCVQIGDNLPLHLLPPHRIDALKTLVETNHIRLEIGARRLTAAHLNMYIELTAFFQSPLLRFVIDDDDYEPNQATIIETIRDSIPLLIKHNITLGIENHDRFKATELVAIMEAIGHERVGICLDCVNSLGAGEGLIWVSDVLVPYTVNLHIKDFVIKRLPHKMGFLVNGVPAGTGMTNIPMLLEKLSPYNRCDSAVLEQWLEPDINIEDTVRRENEWADKGIRYLTQLPQFIGSTSGNNN